MKRTKTAYRWRRFLAFLLDFAVVGALCWLCYIFFGFPDYPAVSRLMDAVNASAGTPAAQDTVTTMLRAFDAAYVPTLILWFGYETLSALIFNGATVGKAVLGFSVGAFKPGSWAVTAAKIICRGVIKFFFLYIFQGLPFLIAQLTIFARPDNRSGVDILSGTMVSDKKTG